METGKLLCCRFAVIYGSPWNRTLQTFLALSSATALCCLGWAVCAKQRRRMQRAEGVREMGDPGFAGLQFSWWSWHLYIGTSVLEGVLQRLLTQPAWHLTPSSLTSVAGEQREWIIKMCPDFRPCPSVKYHTLTLCFSALLWEGSANPQPVSRPRNASTSLLCEHSSDGVDKKTPKHIHMTFLNFYIILRIFFISRIFAAQ